MAQATRFPGRGVSRGVEGGASGGDEPTRGTIFEVLSNDRRRFVLRELLAEGAVPITQLSARLAARENDTPVDALSSRQKKQTYSALYQTHVPKLEDAGMVAYDPADRTVELTVDRSLLRRYLGDDPRDEHRFSKQWSRYFLLVALFASGAIASQWLGTPPATALTADGLHGLLNVLFMVLTISFVMAVEGPKLLRLGE